VQSLDSTDPVGDLGVSLGQSVHGADPVDALYFPVTHAVQLKAGPDEPALQAVCKTNFEDEMTNT
jgi:hypothetical protein